MNSKFEGTIFLWRLVTDAQDPGAGRVVEADVSVTAGQWTVDHTTFSTPPLEGIDGGPLGIGKIAITMPQDAPGSVASPRLELAADLEFTFIKVVGGKNLPSLSSTLALKLDNAADVNITIPQSVGDPLEVTLTVAPYDPAAGTFALAGKGRLTGLLSRDRVALRIEGAFTPPL